MITDLSMQNPSYPSVGSLAYSSPQGFLGPGFQKLGAAQRQRLNRQYDGLMSQVGQRAVNSGLYNTTVPMTEQQAVERGRGQAMTSLDNQLMAEQLGAYSSLTSDALAAELQQRMRSTSERDRLTAEAISNAMGLGLSKIGFVEDREDIAEPVDYDLFYQLGKASYPSASTGASSSSPSASSKKKVDDEPRSQTGSPGGYFPGVSFGSSGSGAFGNGTSGQGIPAGSLSMSGRGIGGGSAGGVGFGYPAAGSSRSFNSGGGSGGSVAGQATRSAEDIINSSQELSNLVANDLLMGRAISGNQNILNDIESGLLEFGTFGPISPVDDYWVDDEHTDEENEEHYARTKAYNRFLAAVNDEQEAAEAYGDAKYRNASAKYMGGDNYNEDYEDYLAGRGYTDNRPLWMKHGYRSYEEYAEAMDYPDNNDTD